jgi:tetratricopeptide (TPR) repeat protein
VIELEENRAATIWSLSLSARPNFFLLLELDPDVDDWQVIALHVQERRRAWARDRSQGSPKLRRKAEIGLGLLPEIESVLKNPETRRLEAKEARRQKQQADVVRLQELDEAIAVLQTGAGTCGPEQIEKLVQRFAPAISREEVLRRVAAAGLRVGDIGKKEKKPRASRETIDPGQARKIRQGLDHLGFADLYEFLGMKPQSSPKALCGRADEIYKESLRTGRTDAEASMRNDLAGYCKALFQDDGPKTRYDNTLAIEAMEGLKANIELAASDGVLSRQEMDTLIRQARQRGVAAESARAFIEDLAATRKWLIQGNESELPAETLKVCGFCSALASAGAVRCASCGEPLEMACPRCGASNPTSQAACASCGCRTGDAPLVQGLLAEGERLALEGDFPRARQYFERALLYWPGWQKAIDARRRAGERQREREQALEAIEALLTARQLTAALTAIERFARTHGEAGLEGLRQRIREGLKKAEALFQEGLKRRRAGDGEGALDRFEEALAVCADHEPTLQEISASPPPSPTDLRASPLASGFRLTWRPPATSRSLTYRLLRKSGGAPRHAEDGDLVGEGRSASCDDLKAPAGVAWHYAVFALRGRVPCPEPAVSGPHFLSLDAVTGLTARRSGPNLALTWSWPPGTSESLVTWAYDRHAEDPLKANGGRARVTRAEYDRAGCWVLPHAERRPHYFAVLARAAGSDLYAPPARVVESMGQALSVSYRVVVKKALLSRKVVEAWVELTSGAADGTEVPPLLMVGKAQGVPLSPRDGESLGEAPATRLDKGRARLPVPEHCWHHRLYVKLFFQDAAAAREIRLLPAEKELLLLG